MSDRALIRSARGVFLFEALLLLVGVTWSLLQPWRPPDVDPLISEYLLLFAFFTFPIVGIFVTNREPRNAVGWILLAIGFVWSLTGTTYNGLLSLYEAYGLRLGTLPGGDVVLALDSGLWVPAVGLMGTFLLLLFPDGRLPSPRWRPVGWFSAASLVVVYALIVVNPGNFKDMGYPNVENPLGLEVIRPISSHAMTIVMLVPISMLTCVAGLIVRFKRSRGAERQQMKLFVAGAGVVGALYFVTMVVSGIYENSSERSVIIETLQTAAIFAFVLIPICVGVAILRYRLYDIDLLINRTLVYGSLTALLAGAYVALVFLLQGALAPFTSGSELAIAASTLAVAALFRPVRARVQGFIDRRFYRRKFDAQRTLEDSGGHLRDEVDLPALSSRLTAVVAQTMQPAHVSLWMRGPSQSDLVTIPER